MNQVYEAPRIADEQFLEAQALACNKTPGQGASNADNFCGTVFIGRVDHQDGCATNLNSRSS